MKTAKQIAIGASVAALLIVAGVLPTCAAVVEAAANGLSVQEHAQVAATPDHVYAALIHPEKWWNSQHTFSGSAANLTLDPKAGGCLCETLPNGGSVQHLIVIFAAPGDMLRLRGAMGPFQDQGVDGALTFTLKAKDGGTDLTLDANWGGYFHGGFDKIATPADGMLADLVTRLKQYAEVAK